MNIFMAKLMKTDKLHKNLSVITICLAKLHV
jgi:hypothetical protein